jgi:NAD(P)-dependent dehydrogenase (short-subunit alcohol dehydrogenase family)
MAERMFVEFPDLPQLYADLTPLGRVGEAGEVSDVVAWLCSDEASFVSGAVLPVDGSLMAGGGAPPAGIGAEVD